jgi:hypothetical protein
MRPLLTLLLACGGEKTDSTADGAEDVEAAPYILPAEEVTAPPFDAAAVTAELESAAARFVSFDASPLIDGYQALLAAGDDGYCPTFGVANDTVYWADACTSETGTRFDGYGYFVDYNGVSDGNGTTYQGAALYGVATIEDADGQRLVAAGGAVQVEGSPRAPGWPTASRRSWCSMAPRWRAWACATSWCAAASSARPSTPSSSMT